MHFSLVTLSLCVASTLAAPFDSLAEQSDVVERSANAALVCPDTPRGTIIQDKANKAYAVFCGNSLGSDKFALGTAAEDFSDCIDKCDAFNLKHFGADGCAALTYNKEAKPQCKLYNLHEALTAHLTPAEHTNSAFLETEASFHKVDLPAPENWIGGNLFPEHVLDMFQANIPKFDAQGWAQFVLNKCKATTGCTSTISFASENFNGDGQRFWFGTIYNGGTTTVGNYTRGLPVLKVRHSTAFTI